MPGATTLFFPEVGPSWEDWVQVTNVGNKFHKSISHCQTCRQWATHLV